MVGSVLKKAVGIGRLPEEMGAVAYRFLDVQHSDAEESGDHGASIELYAFLQQHSGPGQRWERVDHGIH